MSADRDDTGAPGLSGTVDDDLRAAWEQHESGGDGGDEDSGQRSESRNQDSSDRVNIDNAEEKDEKEDTTAGRPRNPDGTFAAKPDDKADQTAKSGKAADQTDKPKAEPDQVKTETKSAAPKPGNWSDIPDEDWAKVPASVQTKLQQREAQFDNWWRSTNQHIAPVAEEAKKRGISWQEGISRLVQAQQRLDANPAEALIWLAKAHNVNLDDLAEMAAGNMQVPQTQRQQQQQPAVPPELMSRLEQLESHIQTSQQSMNLRAIDEFSKQPGYEHFDELIPSMTAILPSIRQMHPGANQQELLGHAYTAALSLSPAILSKLEAQEETERRQQAEAEKQKKKARAAAGVHINGSGGQSPQSRNSTGDVFEDLRQAWDQHTN